MDRTNNLNPKSIMIDYEKAAQMLSKCNFLILRDKGLFLSYVAMCMASYTIIGTTKKKKKEKRVFIMNLNVTNLYPGGKGYYVHF